MNLFGDLPNNPRKSGNILFRLEEIPGRPASFLIQSTIEPDRAKLPRHGRIKEFEFPQFSSGQPLGFRLSINAVVRHSDGRTTPVPIDPTDDGREDFTPWLARKLHPAITEIALINHKRDVLRDRRQRENSSGNRRTIQVDTVDGVTQVGDPDELIKLLTSGVGRAKSYGCGLLTVRLLAS